MMEVISEAKDTSSNLEAKAIRVFLKVIDIIGGPKKLFEYRNLTWLPSLMEAAYVITLSKETMKTEEEIAQELGISSTTIRNILAASEERVKERLQEEMEEKTEAPKTHIAGGLAKIAYQEVVSGRENIDFLVSILEDYYKELSQIIWPIEVLQHIKGVDFPAEKELLKTKLQGIKIGNMSAEEILEKLEYPIKSPSDLLKKLNLQSKS